MKGLLSAVLLPLLSCRSLANEVCTVDEAKAVYPFMAIGANIALVAAGCYIRLVNHTLSTSLAGGLPDHHHSVCHASWAAWST